jgi:hypothetical protein
MLDRPDPPGYLIDCTEASSLASVDQHRLFVRHPLAVRKPLFDHAHHCRDIVEGA